MTNVPKLSNAGAKNAKERRLEYILKVFLNAAGYNDTRTVIADIDFKTIIQVPHSNIKIEKQMSVGAYAHQGTIYLQRKISYGVSKGGESDGFMGVKSLYPYFDYNQFDIENKSIGQGDISVFSKVRKLMAHEMAHAIYGTTDNTQAHFEKMLQIDAQFDSAIANFKATSSLVLGDDIKQKERNAIGATKEDTVVVTYTKGAASQLEKAEPIVIVKEPKYTKKDIFYHNNSTIIDMYTHYFTYEWILDNKGDLSKYIPIGYKVGDVVNIKETSSNAYETKDISEKAKIVSPTKDSLRLQVKFTNDFVSRIPHTDIISKYVPKANKYKDNEILFDDSLRVNRTWFQLKERMVATGNDEEYYLSFYKPTGLKVGDRVKWHETTGKIQKVANGMIIFIADDDGVEYPMLMSEEFKVISSESGDDVKVGKMFSIYNNVKLFLSENPNSTHKQILDIIPELKQNDGYLGNILKKYGQNEIEYSSDRPHKLKLKGG